MRCRKRKTHAPPLTRASPVAKPINFYLLYRNHTANVSRSLRHDENLFTYSGLRCGAYVGDVVLDRAALRPSLPRCFASNGAGQPHIAIISATGPNRAWGCTVPHYFCEAERWIADKQENVIVLDDGSSWEVGSNPPWIRFSSIQVSYTASPTGQFHYVLVNTSYGQQVSAKFLGFKQNKTARSDAA
jgi:hypothetical protein